MTARPQRPITWKKTKTGFSSSRGGFSIEPKGASWLVYDKFGDVAETGTSEEEAKRLGVEILTVRVHKCPLCLEYDHRKLVRFKRQRMCVECAEEHGAQQAMYENEFQQSLEEGCATNEKPA